MSKDINQEGGDRTDRIFDLIEGLIRRSLSVIERDKKRCRLRNELFDDRNKSKIIPSFKAIEIVKEVSRENSGEEFFRLLQRRLGEINSYDNQLGRLIGGFLIKQGLSPLISRICTIFLRYPKERVFEHFKQYSMQYYEKLSRLDNKEIAEDMLNIIRRFLLSYAHRNEQISTVQNLGNSVKNWNPVQDDMILRIEEAKKYIEILRGMNEREVNALLNSGEAQHILVYQREIILLKDVLRRISVGEEEATWKDFLNVYKSMSKIIRAIDERYFDKKTANELRGCFEDNLHYGEQPEPWKAKFNEIEDRLIKGGIKETQEALLDLFGKVITKIGEISEGEFIQARNRTAKVEEEMKQSPHIHKKILLRTIKRLEKGLNARLGIIREKYDNMESSVHKIARRFYELVERLKDINPDYVTSEILGIEAKKGPLTKRGIGIMRLVENREGETSFKAMSGYLLPLFVYENALRQRLGKLTNGEGNKFYFEVPKLIAESWEIIQNFERQLDNLISYLESIGIKDKHIDVSKTNMTDYGLAA